MKYTNCTYCRRKNSHLCNDCHNEDLLLVNDTRECYYINCEGDNYRGPVEAFLLPYKDVWPESYVWTSGMEKWDFAGNVLDRRTLAVNFRYCPCCNGVFEEHLLYPDDRESLYKCKKCGFEFSFGATRPCSCAQSEYAKLFYGHKKSHDSTTIPGIEPIDSKCSSDNQGQECDNIGKRKNNCLPLGTKLCTHGKTIEINEVKEIGTAFIMYSAKLYHNTIYTESKDDFEDVHIVESFIINKDQRANDRKHRIRSGHVIDGITESDFYNLIQRLTSLSFKQVINSFRSQTDSDFFDYNNTQYFVVHKNTKKKMRLSSQITIKNTIYEVVDVCGGGSYGEVLKIKRIKQPIAERIGGFLGKGDWTNNQFVAVKQFCYEEVQTRRKNCLSRDQALKLFKSEYDALFSLNNPGIVKVYQYVDDGDVPYYVMDYIEGTSLADFVYKQGPLHWEHAKGIVVSICEILKYCHSKGIMHGDITPNNIIIGKNGKISLIDFCLSHKRPDYLGVGCLYFDLLTKQYISIPNLYLSPCIEIECAHKILKDKLIPKSIISHILYLFDSAGISGKSPSIDFILNAIKEDIVLPYYKKGITDRIFSKHKDKGKASTFEVFSYNNKWGMKDKSGSIVIPPIYNEIHGIAQMSIPGPGPGRFIIGVKTKRGDMTGWYELNDSMKLEFIGEVSSSRLRELSMLT